MTRFITATTRFEDDVTVFQVGLPPVAKWVDQPVQVKIHPFSRKPLSEESGSNVEDSDVMMLEEVVPDEELLAGELGQLTYSSARNASGARISAFPEAMSLYLFVETDAFRDMTDDLMRSGRRAVQATMSARVELFEHEVDRFFSEHVRRRDFGLLAQDNCRDGAITRARLVGLSFAFDLTAAAPTLQDPGAAPEVEQEDEAARTDAARTIAMAQSIIESQERLRRTVRRAAWLLAGVLLAAAVLARWS